MFLKNYVLFSFCLIVFFINVRLSKCLDDGAFDDEGPPPKREEGEEPAENNIYDTLSKLMVAPPMPFITMSAPVVFEGVDYDVLKNLSSKTYDYYYDCFYWMTKCLKDGVYFHTVCAYNGVSSWINFANMCQLELENCRHRVRNETWKPYEGIFGTNERNQWDYMYVKFYQGDGHNCKYDKFRRNDPRRQMTPDDRVNFYYEDEQDVIEIEG